MTDWLVAGGCQYSEGVINVENNQNLILDQHSGSERTNNLDDGEYENNLLKTIPTTKPLFCKY